eukprot:5692167-Pyramimonas_sp.AAC.1
MLDGLRVPDTEAGGRRGGRRSRRWCASGGVRLCVSCVPCAWPTKKYTTRPSRGRVGCAVRTSAAAWALFSPTTIEVRGWTIEEPFTSRSQALTEPRDTGC